MCVKQSFVSLYAARAYPLLGQPEKAWPGDGFSGCWGNLGITWEQAARWAHCKKAKLCRECVSVEVAAK